MMTQERRGAVLADDFIVSHVNDKEIRLQLRALPRDRHDDVRIDPPHGGVHHLHATIGEPALQHDLKYPPETEGGIRRAHRGRFAQNENAKSAARFHR